MPECERGARGKNIMEIEDTSVRCGGSIRTHVHKKSITAPGNNKNIAALTLVFTTNLLSDNLSTLRKAIAPRSIDANTRA